jgi:molybdopterin molybdotransferase
MKTVEEAQELILSKSKRLGTESVTLDEALGRILAEEVSSNRDHPPYDISAMDGYAVVFADIDNCDKDNPAKLEVIDDITAGSEPKCDVTPGKASRIMTGAPIPNGADTVIRVEDTDILDDVVKILTPSAIGANIRLLGENLRTNDIVLKKDTEIGSAETGILAMVKKSCVLVYKQPTIAVLSTGDELEALDEPFDPKKIPDANSHTVIAELRRQGLKPVSIGIARDTEDALRAKLEEGLGYDILIVSGGVSVGHHDFVRPTLKSLGVEMHFWRVALRPGHPFAFGTGKETLVFALPGNPVSSMVCSSQFIIPSVRAIMGNPRPFKKTITATLKGNVKDKAARLHFMRVKLRRAGAGYSAELTGSQGSGILMSMVEANALLVMPKGTEFLKDGATVTVQLLHEQGYQRTSGFGLTQTALDLTQTGDN